MAHFKTACEHGVVHSQCRCIGPKVVKTVPCMTTNTGVPIHEKCKVAEAPVEKGVTMSWTDRFYAGIGEYLRYTGRDCVEVLDISEELDSGIFTLVRYKDKNKSIKTATLDKSLAKIVEEVRAKV